MSRSPIVSAPYKGAGFLQSTAIYLPYTMVSGVPVTKYKVNVATDALTVTVIGVKDYL